MPGTSPCRASARAGWPVAAADGDPAGSRAGGLVRGKPCWRGRGWKSRRASSACVVIALFGCEHLVKPSGCTGPAGGVGPYAARNALGTRTSADGAPRRRVAVLARCFAVARRRAPRRPGQRAGPAVPAGPEADRRRRDAAKAASARSVALSGRRQHRADRRPRDSSEAGAAWVFTRSGSTWTQQGEAHRRRRVGRRPLRRAAWRSPPTATPR